MTPPAWMAAGLALGLLHAAHCAGMCGVFALRAAGRPGGFVAFGLGKTTTYLFLGALAASAGAGVGPELSGWRHALALLVALSLILAGAGRLGWHPFARGGRLATRAWRVLFGDLLRRDLPGGSFTLGALTGLLPCGVTLVAVLQAAAFGDVLHGVAFMASFGLGTLPVLLATLFAAQRVRLRLGSETWTRLSAGLLISAGVLTLWRAAAPLLQPDSACGLCS
ncbi:MAG: cytochrome biogenesis protein [Planctomycetota bacterium]|nr:MAG: cytochrome biogenesis protein [Planctomycetota bacterium]